MRKIVDAIWAAMVIVPAFYGFYVIFKYENNVFWAFVVGLSGITLPVFALDQIAEVRERNKNYWKDR